MRSSTKALILIAVIFVGIGGVALRAKALFDQGLCDLYGICEVSYEQYYQSGYESGYQGGYESSYQASYQGGYQTTYQTSYESGYGGYEVSYQFTYESGYQTYPSCGAAGGNSCGVACPAGYTSTNMGPTYDCSPCLRCDPPLQNQTTYEQGYQTQYQIDYSSNQSNSSSNTYYSDPGYYFSQVTATFSATAGPADASANVSLCFAGQCQAATIAGGGSATLGPIAGGTGNTSYSIYTTSVNTGISVSISAPQDCIPGNNCAGAPTPPPQSTGTVCTNVDDIFDYYITGPGVSWTGAGSQCWSNEPAGHYDATGDHNPNVSSTNSDLIPGGSITISLQWGHGGCTDPAASNYNPSANRNDGSCVYCAANTGQACSSGANGCGQVGNGVIQCDGSCNAVTPPNNQCPAPSTGAVTYTSPNYCLSGPGGTINWSYSDPQNSPQSSYQIQIANGGNFGSLAYDSGQINSTSNAFAIPNGTLQFNHSYQARVRVWDSLGAVSAWTNSNAWNTPPYAYPQVAFNFSPNPAQQNVVEQFTDQTVFSGPANGRSWSWTFGDGATSTTQNPTHIYNNIGSYDATITATDAAGQTCGPNQGVVGATKRVNVGRVVPQVKEVAP